MPTANPANKVVMNTSLSNTATPSRGTFDWAKCLSYMLIPANTRFTAADMLTPYTTLTNLAQHNTESSRGFPVQDMLGIENKSDGATINAASNFGGKSLASRGYIHYLWKYTKGGMNRENLLSKFIDKQEQYKVLLFDEVRNTIVGTKSDTSGYVMQGFSLDQIYTEPFKITDGSADTEHYFGLCFSDITEFTERLIYYALPVTPAAPQTVKAIKGLSNLELVIGTALTVVSATGVVKIAIETDYGGTDLYPLYGSALQALTWTASQDAGGTAITTAVALDATTSTLQFTFSGSGWTGLASGATLTLYSPSVSAMAATVPLFGNASIQLTKP